MFMAFILHSKTHIFTTRRFGAPSALKEFPCVDANFNEVGEKRENRSERKSRREDSGIPVNIR